MPNPKTLEAVAARAATVADLRRQLTDEITALRVHIVAADRDGHGRNQIAKAAAPGLSRKLVFEALGAADLYTAAEEALQAAGYTTDSYMLTASQSVKLALATWACEPDEPVSDRPDYREGDPYWDEQMRQERARVEERRRELAEGLLAALAEAGIAASGDEDALLGYEDVVLSKAS